MEAFLYWYVLIGLAWSVLTYACFTLIMRNNRHVLRPLSARDTFVTATTLTLFWPISIARVAKNIAQDLAKRRR